MKVLRGQGARVGGPELWGQWCRMGLTVGRGELKQDLVGVVRRGALFQEQSEASEGF